MSIRKAFTLVELLVVIAIIAVLLAILLPSLAHVKELALRIRCGNAMRGVGMAIKFYADGWDGKLMQLEYRTQSPDSAAQAHPFWTYRGLSGEWQPVSLGGLHKYKLIESPSTFYCPADILWKDMMKAYTIGASGQQIQWGESAPMTPTTDPFMIELSARLGANLLGASCVRINTAYWPQSRKLMKNGRGAYMCMASSATAGLYEDGYSDLAYKIADLDSSKACVSDNGGHAVGGSAIGGEKSKGQNALFGDGHVVFGKPPRDPSDASLTYRLRLEGEDIVIKDGVSNRSNRYFFYLQP